MQDTTATRAEQALEQELRKRFPHARKLTVTEATIRVQGEEPPPPGREIPLARVIQAHDRHRKAQWLSRAARPRAARMPIARCRERRDSGRRRKAAATRASGSRSGQDPGDPDKPEPPQAGRLCQCGCGRSLEHLRRDAQTFGESCRKRVQRAREREERAHLADRLDNHRRDPYLEFEPGELERLRRRVEEGCCCNGHHIPDETGDHCAKCGHDRGALAWAWKAHR
jgi:hypothetical protein